MQDLDKTSPRRVLLAAGSLKKSLFYSESTAYLQLPRIEILSCQERSVDCLGFYYNEECLLIFHVNYARK